MQQLRWAWLVRLACLLVCLGSECIMALRTLDLSPGELPSDSNGDVEEACRRQSIPMCPLSPHSDDEGDQSTDSGEAAAVVVKKKIWKEREQLNVLFMKPEVLEGWGIGVTPQIILEWAGVWRRDSNSKVPMFKQTTSTRRADIRVEFSDEGGCWSMIGKRAESVKKPAPTMMLNLSNDYCADEQGKRSLVIHEFGHALGLDHEHQRSDFWDAVEPYFDVTRMKDDSRVSDAHSEKDMSSFGKDWFKKRYGERNGIRRFFGIKKKSQEQKVEMSEYDSDSIMHYSFDVDWFKDHRLRRKQSLKAIPDTEIDPKVKTYLMGVHKRHNRMSRDPSSTDLASLESAYDS